MKLNKTQIALAVLLLIIFVQSFILVFRTNKSAVSTDNVDALKEQIKVKVDVAKFWEEKASEYKSVADKAIAKSDSLEKIKPIIKHYYYETYKFIPTATNKQLDSIIRANW